MTYPRFNRSAVTTMVGGSCESKMAADRVLHRFAKLPTRNHSTALFVGIKGIGKHRVAQAITDCNSDFSLQIRTATSLPLPEDSDGIRPRIDFVVFFVDLTNKLSFDVVKSSARYLDVGYFLGHCCFVATNVRDESSHNVRVQEVVNLSDSYDSPLLCAELQSKEEQGYLAKRLMHYLKPATKPLLLDSTKRPVLVEDTMTT